MNEKIRTNKSKFNLSLELEKIITSFEPLYENSGSKTYSNLIPNADK